MSIKKYLLKDDYYICARCGTTHNDVYSPYIICMFCNLPICFHCRAYDAHYPVCRDCDSKLDGLEKSNKK